MVADPNVPVQDNPAALAQFILDAIAGKQWWVVASAGVLLITWAVRNFGVKLFPKLAAFLHEPVVSWALPSVLSLIAGVTLALTSGKPIVIVDLIGEVLKVAFGAIAMYVGAKKIAEARAEGKAAAAQAVTDKQSAISVIISDSRKGPNP
jgi:hypothetical protein